MRSNKINSIYVDGDEDLHFICTDEGVVVGKGGRWGLEERYFAFQAIANRGKEVWLLADDLIWIVDGDKQWRSLSIDLDEVQGEIKDIALDKNGKLWIASEYLTVFDIENEDYKIFDGADYFTSNDVNTLTVDKTGAVWVGTQDKGLYLIEEESAMTVTVLLDKPLSCDPTVNDASLVVKINGGQPPYSYSWGSASLSGNEVADLGPGLYQLTVTDSKGISKSTTGEVPDTRLKLKLTENQSVGPDGNARGSASAEVEGGKPRYIFQWDNGEMGPLAERLDAGIHQVTVTDANGCKAEASIEIGREIGDLLVNIEKTGENSCEGEKANAVSAIVTGGLGPYTYQWSDGSIAGSEATGLAAGTYRVTVTDSQGSRAEASVNFNEVANMELEVTANEKADLDGQNGAAIVRVVGGNGRMTYTWDNGEDKARATRLETGVHQVTVTDANGCTAIGSVEIVQEIGVLAVRIEKINESQCADDGMNEIAATISGGIEPYTLTWSDPGLSGPEHKGLPGGTYYLTVTDGAGNKTEKSVLLQNPAPLQIDAIVNSAASTGNNDGKASLEVKGGTGTYTYQWDNGENQAAATALSPGAHSVTVTDENGCREVAQLEITENILALAVNLTKTEDNNCYGENKGALSAEVQGGKGPFTYTWSDAALDGSSISQLGGGTYSLTVSDAAGNTANASMAIASPLALEAQVVEQRGVTDETTDDGRAEVQVTGGTAPYTYQWDNQSTESRVENLTFGSHHVTVTDANGCNVVLDLTTEKKILPQLTLSKLREGEVVQMQMLQFDADSTNLNDGAKPILDEVYYFLKDNPGVVIRVEGHTNNIPPDEFCDKLSTARAQSVAEYIVQQGVADERVYYRGYGKRQPLYSNRTAEGRRKNQRVEIKILTINEDG